MTDLPPAKRRRRACSIKAGRLEAPRASRRREPVDGGLSCFALRASQDGALYCSPEKSAGQGAPTPPLRIFPRLVRTLRRGGLWRARGKRRSSRPEILMTGRESRRGDEAACAATCPQKPRRRRKPEGGGVAMQDAAGCCMNVQIGQRRWVPLPRSPAGKRTRGPRAARCRKPAYCAPHLAGLPSPPNR